MLKAVKMFFLNDFTTQIAHNHFEIFLFDATHIDIDVVLCGIRAKGKKGRIVLLWNRNDDAVHLLESPVVGVNANGNHLFVHWHIELVEIIVLE